jgi:hypothetical protein
VLLPESSRSSPLLHVGPCRRFLSELDEAPCLARFSTFLARSSEFFIFSGLVLGLLGVVFTSLLDLYQASRSCHEVLNELIPEVLLSTLKPCINTNTIPQPHITIDFGVGISRFNNLLSVVINLYQRSPSVVITGIGKKI